MRRCPFFIEPLLLTGYTVVFFVVASRQRRAVTENVATLVPGLGWLGCRVRALRVFWEFAWMLVDGARARGGERHVTWRLDGMEAFQAAESGGGGALLLTAHMGNYDVAGPFFAEKFGRLVHGVRRPERRKELQAYMQAQHQAQAGSMYRVQYNVAGGFLGLELAQALEAGEVVAIQGDRVGDGMGSVAVEWRGRLWRLPSGPLVLAQVAKAPIFPVFTVRDGWRSYRILFLPARAADSPSRSRAERVEAQQQLAVWWASTLAGVLVRYWDRWLMFEPAFEPIPLDSREKLPVIDPVPLPPRSATSRPERPSAHGWQPTLKPISRTALGRFLNRCGFLLPADTPHQLRAEESAQNWVEVVVLAGFSGILTAAACWQLLAMIGPTLVMVWILPFTCFALLHAAPAFCGLVASGLLRLRGVATPARTSRLGEEIFLSLQTGVALLLLWTPCHWLGVAWLALAAANTLCFVLLWALLPRENRQV